MFPFLQTSGGLGSEIQFPFVEHLSLSLARIDHVYPEAYYVPKRNRFATRLTAFCRLTNVEPAITSLLGFLPQDLEQVSIFDLVHTSDLLKIYDAYKEGKDDDSRKFNQCCFVRGLADEVWQSSPRCFFVLVGCWGKHVLAVRPWLCKRDSPNLNDDVWNCQ